MDEYRTGQSIRKLQQTKKQKNKYIDFIIRDYNAKFKVQLAAHFHPCITPTMPLIAMPNT